MSTSLSRTENGEPGGNRSRDHRIKNAIIRELTTKNLQAG